MNAYDLAPCPFCFGKELRIHERRFANREEVFRQVECSICGATGPPHLDNKGDGGDQVERFWNHRA